MKYVNSYCPNCHATTKFVINFSNHEEKDSCVEVEVHCHDCGKKKSMRLSWEAWKDYAPKHATVL